MSWLYRLFPFLPWCRPLPPKPEPPTSGPEFPPQGDTAAQCVEAHNAVRRKQGLQPFTKHECLARQAQQWAENMAYADEISHKGFWSRLGACNIGAGGENVAAGQISGQEVTDDWMDSPGHRANILKSSFRQIGVGYFYNASSRYKHFWCAMYTI